MDPNGSVQAVAPRDFFSISSERRLCEEAGSTSLGDGFRGASWSGQTAPRSRVLSKARRRFGPAIYELLFKRVVAVCEECGLVQGAVVFLSEGCWTSMRSQSAVRCASSSATAAAAVRRCSERPQPEV